MSQTDVESILQRLRRHLTGPSRAQQGPPLAGGRGEPPCRSPAALADDLGVPRFCPGACLTPLPAAAATFSALGCESCGWRRPSHFWRKTHPGSSESFSDVTPLTHTTAAGISDAFLRPPRLLGRVHGPNTRRGNLAEDAGGARRLPRADAVTEESGHVGAAACPKTTFPRRDWWRAAVSTATGSLLISHTLSGHPHSFGHLDK